MYGRQGPIHTATKCTAATTQTTTLLPSCLHLARRARAAATATGRSTGFSVAVLIGGLCWIVGGFRLAGGAA